MSKIKVQGYCKKGDTIAKFKVSPPINIDIDKTYYNIDEASDSKLVQHLFYLPFVKKVELKRNLILIEKFQILEWEEVIDEVAAEIKKLINSNKEIEHSSNENDTKSVSIYAESTPNPNAMKFVANKRLSDQALTFDKIDKAEEAPLIKKLFNFPFVKEIFLDENYISILKKEDTSWEGEVMEIREFLQSYLREGGEILSKIFYEKNIINSDSKSKSNLTDIEKKIVSILEEYVKPAVASDGGNIIFESYDNSKKVVKVLLQGACSGCPSSTYTLRNGIENILKDMLPGKIELVEAINA
jgi:Fe-S cluster biogenesis protein NfuA/ubiquitin